MALFIAMNHFQVDPGARRGVRGALAEARDLPGRGAGLPALRPAARRRAGRLRLALDLAEPRGLRSLDALRGLPQGARAGAHAGRPAARASAARAVRSGDRAVAAGASRSPMSHPPCGRQRERDSVLRLDADRARGRALRGDPAHGRAAVPARALPRLSGPARRRRGARCCGIRPETSACSWATTSISRRTARA